MKTKPKQKSLGQVAFEEYFTAKGFIVVGHKAGRIWHRVARAVVNAAKLKPHLNSAAKVKHN